MPFDFFKKPSSWRSFFESIENDSKASPLFVSLTLFAVVFLRILLEYSLEFAREIEPFQSLLLFFMYFATVLAVLILLLTFFTGKRPLQTARVVAFFSPILFIPPLVDFLASGGSGFSLSFVFSKISWVDAFATFCGNCPGVSIGLKVEVAAALMIVLVYVLSSTRSWVRGAAASAVFYSFVLFGALWPGVLMLGLGHAFQDVFLYRELLSSYAIFLSLSFLGLIRL